MRNILAGVAALALIPAMLHADPGGGKGGGQGGGQGQAKGGGNAGHADHGKPERGNDANRGNTARRGGSDVVQIGGGDRGKPGNSRNDRAAPVRAERGNGQGSADRSSGYEDARVVQTRRDTRGEGRSWGTGPVLVTGCPPGLAKKNNGCQPPGLARQNAAYYNSDWYRWRGLDQGDYRYYDGYLVRPGGGYVPLLGGALALGNRWPEYISPVAMPDYYRDYYGLGDNSGYRYYGDTIYRVDPGNSAISSIAALLTGDRFAVGQQMPDGYDVYNVPYDYRDRYADGPDSMYRYSDGYVYQADPKSGLIEAVISLLT
jgi:hypothetical protein